MFLIKDFNLFKDKINLKPPSGKGFKHHRDGIFKFTKDDKVLNGWYSYADDFYNFLICLDDFTLDNGTLQIYDIEYKTFEEYYNEPIKTVLQY